MVLEKGKELKEAQAPLLQLQTELTSLEEEKGAKMGELWYICFF